MAVEQESRFATAHRAARICDAPSGRTGGSWQTASPALAYSCSSSNTSWFFSQLVRALSTICAMLAATVASIATMHTFVAGERNATTGRLLQAGSIESQLKTTIQLVQAA